MAKCGGLTAAQPAVAEVQEICDLVTNKTLSMLFLSFRFPLPLSHSRTGGGYNYTNLDQGPNSQNILGQF